VRVLKINGQGPVEFWARVLENYRQPANAKEEGDVTKADILQLSSEGRFIQEIKAIAARDDTIRVKLVETIRARIASGDYDIAVSDLADAILKELGR
jgi:flagellar biosynthesis anti-sigma factor FlgM